jgi:peptidyl-prolyl cis-trans isomerase SurA
MRIRTFILALALVQACPSVLHAQQVVDRIVARIEDDILTLSEMQELGRFQQLANGAGAARELPQDDELLRQLIDQWIVNTEATVARFPHPSKEEVQTEVARLAAQFGSAEAYRARLKDLGLTPESVARQVERQIYLSRYLDYKLRPTTSVESAEVEKYYREELVPELKKRGQAVPAQEIVEDQIRELLTQREISARVAKWLEDTRSRLKIDIVERKKTP